MSTSEISRQLSVKTEHPLKFDIASLDKSLKVDDKNNDQEPHFDVQLKLGVKETLFYFEDAADGPSLAICSSAEGLLQLKDGELSTLEATGGLGVFCSNAAGEMSVMAASMPLAALAGGVNGVTWHKVDECKSE